MVGGKSSCPKAAAVLVAGLVVLLSQPSPAAAHTGLPASGAADGALHPLVGWDHLLAMLAVGVVAATVARRKEALLVPAGFVVGMVGGGLLGLSGTGLAARETLIAVSVVASGAALWVKVRPGAWVLPAVAAAFGAVHGHAHGAEVPAGAVPVAYIAGFVASTAVLHLAGGLVGVTLRRAPQLRRLTGAAVSAAGLALLVGG